MHTALVLAAIAAGVVVCIRVIARSLESFRVIGAVEEKQIRTAFLLNGGFPVAEDRSYHNRSL
jgi:hypothetical protein